MLSNYENSIVEEIITFREKSKGLVKYINSISKKTLNEIDDNYEKLLNISTDNYFIKYQHLIMFIY